jgi:DNA-binding MarR family transcriptional regulator
MNAEPRTSRRRAQAELTAVLDALRLIIRELRVSSRAAEMELGVSAAQLFVLNTLRDSPASSVNELAERTLTHQSSVSVVVNRLVERKLVTRTRSADDARRMEIALTASGRALARRAPTSAQQRLVDAICELPDAEIRRLAALLTAVVRDMGADGVAPMMFEDGAARRSTAVSASRSTKAGGRRRQ